MNRLTIMGASIALLLAAFVLTPAEAYHKRHTSGIITITHTARPRIISFSISPTVALGTSTPIPRGGSPVIVPRTAR